MKRVPKQNGPGNLSERHQVLIIILTGAVFIGLVSYFSLYFKTSEINDTESTIKGIQNQMAARGLLLDEETLQKKRDDESRYKQELQQEWLQTVSRLSAFPKEYLSRMVPTVDYKQALIQVRDRLQRKSESLGIRLPYDLGIREGVRSDEDPRRLMLQLRTVEKLVDIALNLKINMLQQIEPLPPIQRKTGDTQDTYIEEYPVAVDFLGSLENVYDLFGAVMEADQVFFLKNLRIEAASFDQPGLLKVSATLSGLVFLKDPSELKPVPTQTPRWHQGPLGV
jgi:hypothetical protein